LQNRFTKAQVTPAFLVPKPRLGNGKNSVKRFCKPFLPIKRFAKSFYESTGYASIPRSQAPAWEREKFRKTVLQTVFADKTICKIVLRKHRLCQQ